MAKNARSKTGTTMPLEQVVLLAIGIENYQNPSGRNAIGAVAYAKADVDGVVEVIRAIYGDEIDVDVHLLKDQDATLTTMTETVRYLIRGLSETELFIFYYAGHGFHRAGDNRLTAWDTNPGNLPGTTLNFQTEIIDRLKVSACRRALLFVDACAETLAEVLPGRSTIESLDLAEIERALDEGDYMAVFLSCSPGEKSYGSGELGHGVFTGHVLRALRGEVEEALEADRWLTDTRLRDWLGKAVRSFVTKKMTVSGSQTPRAIINAQQSFRIRHVPKPAGPPARTLADLRLVNRDAFLEGEETGAIRSLEGFTRDKGHRVPTSASPSVDAWIERLMKSDLSAELDELRSASRAALDLARSETAVEWGDGGGGLDTPAFRYTILCDQNPADPAEYRVRRQLTLRDGWEADREKVEEIFEGTNFQRLVVEIDASKASFDDIADTLDALARRTGGAVEERSQQRRLIYRIADERVVIDLKQGRVELKLSADTNLGLIDRARTFGLGWRQPSPLLPPPPTDAPKLSRSVPGATPGSKRRAARR
jgi:hypothetical protein